MKRGIWLKRGGGEGLYLYSASAGDKIAISPACTATCEVRLMGGLPGALGSCCVLELPVPLNRPLATVKVKQLYG